MLYSVELFGPVFFSVFILNLLLTKLSLFFILGARSLAGGRRMYGRSDRAPL